jgi:hypothetical protein
LVGLSPVTLGALGSVPAGALVDVAGLASAEDATTVLAVWISDGVTLEEVTTPLTMIVPLVNGLDVEVQETCWPLGAAQVQPVPEAPTGSTPLGSVSVTVTGWFSVAPDELAATL